MNLSERIGPRHRSSDILQTYRLARRISGSLLCLQRLFQPRQRPANRCNRSHIPCRNNSSSANAIARWSVPFRLLSLGGAWAAPKAAVGDMAMLPSHILSAQGPPCTQRLQPQIIAEINSGMDNEASNQGDHHRMEDVHRQSLQLAAAAAGAAAPAGHLTAASVFRSLPPAQLDILQTPCPALRLSSNRSSMHIMQRLISHTNGPRRSPHCERPRSMLVLRSIRAHGRLSLSLQMGVRHRGTVRQAGCQAPTAAIRCVHHKLSSPNPQHLWVPILDTTQHGQALRAAHPHRRSQSPSAFLTVSRQVGAPEMDCQCVRSRPGCNLPRMGNRKGPVYRSDRNHCKARTRKRRGLSSPKSRKSPLRVFISRSQP